MPQPDIVHDSRAKKDATTSAAKNIGIEAKQDTLSTIGQEAIAVAWDVALSGASALILPLTIGNAIYWTRKNAAYKKRNVIGQRVDTVMGRFFGLSGDEYRNRRNHDLAVKKAEKAAKRRVASSTAAVVATGIGAVRGYLTLQNPADGRHGLLVKLMDFAVGSNADLHSFFLSHNPSFLATVTTYGLVALAQLSNVWLETAKKRNFEKRLG